MDLVFSDVWGPAPTSVGKNSYYVSFIDDYSKFTWIYLLHHKLEVFSCFRDFQNLVERQFGRKILKVQTDWGGEYQTLNSFFRRIGIEHLISCPHAHQQNGSAESKHRHIVEIGLSLLAHAAMPLKFWDEAFLTAVFLINRLPSKVIHSDTHLMSASMVTNPTTPSLESLVVPAGPTFVHTTPRNCNSALNGVSSLATAIHTRGLSV